METANLIAIATFCSSHEIESEFIYEIHESGLIELLSVEDVLFIREEHLSDIERMVRLRRDFNLNSDGIAAIFQLLNKISTLEEENVFLKNKLKIYED